MKCWPSYIWKWYWYVMIWRGLPLKAWLRCWPTDDPITEYIMQPDLPSSSPHQCNAIHCNATQWNALLYSGYISLHCNIHCTTFHSIASEHSALHFKTLQYTVHRVHAGWWYHWIGNGLRCAANDPNQNSTISHKNAPSRQIIIQTGQDQKESYNTNTN